MAATFSDRSERLGPALAGPTPWLHRPAGPRRRLGASRMPPGLVVAALSVAALVLVAPADVRGQSDQTWTFSLASVIVGGTPQPIPGPPPSTSVVVSRAGTFSGTVELTAPLAVPATCPPPVPPATTIRISFSGTMTASLNVSGTVTACGLDVPFSASDQRLDAPFPQATQATVTVDVPTSAGRVVVTVGGVCSLGCAVPGSQPLAQATAGAQQAAALGNLALITTGVQTTNIGTRLAALRRGAAGVSLGGLSLNVDGQPLALGPLASVIAAVDAGAGERGARRRDALGGLGLFANGQGSFGAQDSTSREVGFDFHTAGITLGADYRFTDKIVFGGAFGYLRTKSDFHSSTADSKIDGYSVSAYGTYYLLEQLYVDGIATFGWNNYHTERDITLPTASATAKGSTDGRQFALSVSTGYDFTFGAFTLGATGRVNYVRVDIDSYRERGADQFNLNVRSQTVESVTTALGGQATYAISMSWGVLSPLVRFEWEHEYKGDSRRVSANVVADPDVFVTVQTNNPDRDYFNLGGGVTATFKRGLSAFLYYEALLGRANFVNHAFTGGVRVEF